jgi:hypothetical protein
MRRTPQRLIPLNPTARTPRLLWPRTRRINRHIIDRALRTAAFGSHVCRPFPVRRGDADL